MILDGKVVADDIKQQLKQEVVAAIANGSRRPRLIILSAGDDPASKIYVRNKIKAATEIGIVVDNFTYGTTEKDKNDMLTDINIYNNSDTIDGIMVQLPLPEGWNERYIIDAITPPKDVDGLTTLNIGLLRSGQECLKPCTAQGIIDLCKYYNIELDGKDVTIVGRSNIVGKPLADLMMAAGATVTQCHSHTFDVRFHTLAADIVVSAVGKPKFITEKMIRCGAIVIDVGINRDENGNLCGDVDYENVWVVSEHITPVPGGVGPMTVAELMKNVIQNWRNNKWKK